MIIREMVLADGGAVIDIYNRALRSGHASFQENGGTWSEWDGGHLLHCRYVADDGGGKVLGWAGLSSVSGRCAYACVAEISLYVHPDFPGAGEFGRQFLSLRLVRSVSRTPMPNLDACKCTHFFPEKPPDGVIAPLHSKSPGL